MILVTGAAGKTGRAVIRALLVKGEAVLALVHRPDQMDTIESLGVKMVCSGDMRDRDSVDRATQGARAIYHICPNVSPDEVSIGQTVIAAARSAGIEHFVYHSVLHPQIEAMPHHWRKLRVEEQLFESGLVYTVLQPTTYMQNVLAHRSQILEGGKYPVPYSVETRLSMVDLEDVALVAARVLTEPGHFGATYELVGVEAISQIEVAAALSQNLGRPVRAETVPLDLWEQEARSSGLGDYQVKALVKMFLYYERYGFCGNSRVLNWLLDHPHTSFATFIKRNLQESIKM